MQTGLAFAAVIAVLLIFIGVAWSDRRRAKARNVYQQHLEDALADGVLSEQEAIALDAVRTGHALTPYEVRMVALTIYRRALQDAVSDARITEDESESLDRLQQQLDLSEADLAADAVAVRRVRLLGRIERGDLPTMPTPVSLEAGEVCHWAVQARTARKLAVPNVRDDLTGVKFNIDADTHFELSGRRDELEPSENILPLDLGMLMVSSRRTIFEGARKNITIPHTKLTSITVFRDGLRLDIGGDSSHFILVDDPELTAAMILTAARGRPTQTHSKTTERSA